MAFIYTGTGEIPKDTTVLYFYHNKLTSLPLLPAGLKTLYCGNNQLTSLPNKFTECLNCRDFNGYNSLINKLKILQCIYKKRYLKKQRMGKLIANWIFEQGIKPNGIFAKMAIKRAYERY